MHWITLPLVGLVAVSSASDASDICLKAPKPRALRCGVPGKLTRPVRARNGLLGESLVQRLEECAALCEQTNDCKFLGYDTAGLCSTFKFTGQRMGFQKDRSYARKFYNMGCWTHDGCEPPTVPSPPITPPPPQIPDNGDDEPVSPVPTPPQSNTPAPQEPTLPEGPEEGEEIPVPTRPNTPEPPEPTVPDDTDEDGDVYVTPISTPPQSTTPEPEEPSVPEDTTCGPLPSVTTSSGAQYDSFYCGVGQDFNSDQVQEYGSTLFVDVEELDDNLAITGCADMAESAGYSSFNVRHHPGGWYCTPFQWPGVSGVDWKFAEPTVGSSYAYQVASTRPARGGRGGTVIQRARLRHR